MDDDDTEPAAEVILAPHWVFKLAARDALLVLKALGGRLLTDEDKNAAMELGDRLTALRHKYGFDLAAALERAYDGMEEAREMRGVEPSPLKPRSRGRRP